MKSTGTTDVILWPLLLYIILSILLVAVMLGLSYILGQKSRKLSREPFESGMEITGSARLRFPSKFYLIAMFFVLFDIESVFIITWAITFREMGWPGYIGVLIFIGILFVVLLYEWRIGALDIEPSGKKILEAYTKHKDKAVVG
jgi:NADH-quinone oxidoreductase subunit A